MITYTKQFISGYIAALEDVQRIYPSKDTLDKELSRFRQALSDSPYSSSFVRMEKE